MRCFIDAGLGFIREPDAIDLQNMRIVEHYLGTDFCRAWTEVYLRGASDDLDEIKRIAKRYGVELHLLRIAHGHFPETIRFTHEYAALTLYGMTP